MKTNLSTTHCAIGNCTTTILNKPPGVSFHSCPTNTKLKKKWLKILKDRCSMLDWAKSMICSIHFELKYFDSQRRLRPDAIPTLFANNTDNFSHPTGLVKICISNLKVDRLLKKLTQDQLIADIKNTKLQEPTDIDGYVTNDLQCIASAPNVACLWLLVKKQEHLNNQLQDLLSRTKEYVEVLESNLNETRNANKENEHTIESLKYAVTYFQEKQTRLEEQIEVLTAVESR